MSAATEFEAGADEWPELSRLEQLDLLQAGLVQALIDGQDERASVIAAGIRSIQLDIGESFLASLLNAASGIWHLH